MRKRRAAWSFGIFCLCVSGHANSENLGLVVLDGSLGGESGQLVTAGVDPVGGEADYLITQDLGFQLGDNRFYSFSDFGVGLGEIALFSDSVAANPQLANLVVRVTGGGVSAIDGLLRSTIVGADFYLLNPNGISFGMHGGIDANVTVGGFHSFQGASVFLSTADRLEFDTSVAYLNASGTDTPFSSADCCGGQPTAFSFLGASSAGAGPPADIHVDTQFTSAGFGTGVDTGQTFAAVGGTVRVTALNLTARGGVLGLVAVGNAEARVPADLSLDGSWLQALGTEARVDVESTLKTYDDSVALADQGSGRIVLRGGELWVEDSDFLVHSVGEAGIDLVATGGITLLNSGLSDVAYRIDAAGFLIEAEALELKSSTLTSVAGDIVVEVDGELLVHGMELEQDPLTGTIEPRHSRIRVTTAIDEALEKAPGKIELHAGSLEISEGGRISSSTGGGVAAGKIEIRADSSIRLLGGEGRLAEINARGGIDGSQGDGGDILLEAPLIEILDGAAVSASTVGTGAGGDVTISGDTLRIAGQSADGLQLSGVYAETGPRSDTGNGGEVKLTLQHLIAVEDGAEISVETNSSGDAGSVVIDVANGSLQLSGGAEIRAASFEASGAEGAAGDIEIVVATDVVIVDAFFRTASKDDGGNIHIDAGGNVEFVRSVVETDVRGEGRGGNVEIGQHGGVPRLVLLDSSDITATAVKGAGGNIEIAAAGFLASVDSVVDATSKLGIDGAVDVSAPVVQVEGRLDPLPASYLDVSALLRDHCAARRSAGASSFTLQGRPAIPPEPGDFLPSSLRSADDARVRGGAEMHPVSTFLPLRAQLSAFDPGCGGPGQTITAGG